MQIWRYLTCSGDDVSVEGVDNDNNSRPPVKPRSISYNSLDWFSRRLEWQDLVASGSVEKAETNIDELDSPPTIRQSCVKSESPTVVHQSESTGGITAMTAEFVPFTESVERPLVQDRNHKEEIVQVCFHRRIIYV